MLIIWVHSVWASPGLDHLTAHWLPAALPTPALLSIHSTLATFLLCRDQRYLIRANNEQEHLLYTKALCPSSPESSGWAKILAFVYMWCLPEIIFLWLLESLAERRQGLLLFLTPTGPPPPRLAVVVWMRNVPLRLWHLKPSSPVGSTIWRDVRSCRLVGRSASREVGFESYPTSGLSASCLLLKTPISQLPIPAASLWPAG